MKTTYYTANSVYEVDEGAKTIQRISGANEPTARFAGPDPKPFTRIFLANYGTGRVLIAQWPDGASTITSYVERTERVIGSPTPIDDLTEFLS